MPRPSLSRLTSAHAIALLALFISLGGTSYAVTKLPKNSVASPQVKDGSLTAKDLASGVVTAGPQGTPGPRGPRGTEGQTGPAGPTGVRGADGSNALPTIRIASTGDSAIALTATSEYQFGKVLTMPNVPAGTYRIDLTGTVDLEPAKPAPSATAAVIAYCSMYVYGVSQQESSAVRVSIVGTILKVDAIHSDRSTLADTGVVTMKEAFTLFLQCTGNIVAPKVQLVHTKLTMTPLQSFAVVAQ